MKTNNIRAYYALLFLSALPLLLSCNSNNESNNDSDDIPDEEDYASIIELIGDTVEGEKVSRECAIACYKVEQVKEEVNTVQSPQQLMQLKKKYTKSLKSAIEGTDNLVKDEQLIVKEHASEADESYRKACIDYEVPADGVIQNLKDLIQRLDKIQTKDEFSRFEGVRFGMLQELDDIHLCVEHNDRRINEVKRLAQVLKTKYQDKKHALGIN